MSRSGRGKADSEVPGELVEAYLATHYRVGSGADAFTLRIGEPSPALVRLYAANGHACAAFITAWNPLSIPQPPQVNSAAHARLCEALERHGIPFIEGAGVDPGGGWREQSVLALGLAREPAKELGRAYRQNAIVWVGGDAVPRLCLLR